MAAVLAVAIGLVCATTGASAAPSDRTGTRWGLTVITDPSDGWATTCCAVMVPLKLKPLGPC